MHSITRFFTCFTLVVGFVATANLANPSAATMTQEFRLPAANSSQNEPEAVIVTASPNQPAEDDEQHSILDAGQNESIAAETKSTDTSRRATPAQQVPIPERGRLNSTFNRVEGDGSNAFGTFAKSENNSAEPQQAASQPPAIPSITDNRLRGDSNRSPALNPTTRNESRLTDQPGWDEQPTPPLPSQRLNSSPSSMPSMKAPPFGSRNARSFTRPPSAHALNPQANQVGQSNQISSRQRTQENSRAFASPIQSSFEQTQKEQRTIQPTQFQQSLQENQSPNLAKRNSLANLKQARQIMQRYEVDNVPDPLPGRPVKLLEMLETTPIQHRKQMISQYWETHFDWASLLNSKQFLRWMQQLPNPLDSNEQMLLKTAKASAKNQVLADEIQLGKSQSKLQQFMVRSNEDLLPLPADVPLIQTYDTHYQWFESRGRIPVNLRGIDTMLPKTIQLISDRADTVATSRIALNQVRAAYVANPRAVGSVLEAARLWKQAEQSLVSSIVSYNQAVGDYSLTVAQGNKSPQQIVSMLITKPRPVAPRMPQRQTAGTNDLLDRSLQNMNQTSDLGARRAQNNRNQSGRDPNNRAIGERADLSPNGYSLKQPPSRPATFNRRQPQSNPSGQFPINSQPTNNRTAPPKSSFEPSPANPPSIQPPAGDRSAFRDTNSFGGPPVSPRNSKSANEFSSFGR